MAIPTIWWEATLPRQPTVAGARHDLLQEGPSMPGRRNQPRTPRRRPGRGRRSVHRRRGGPTGDTAGLLAIAAFTSVLVPQIRQGLQLYGADIAAVTVAVLAGGALTLLLVKAARRGASGWAARRRRPEGWDIRFLDGLHHRQFEEAVRDLMRRDGVLDAVRVGGAGDNGADVKGTDPAGRRWVIQCKHRVRHEVALLSGRR
nr:restriction endonuclease [Streptomyces sp. NBC_01426]